MHIYTSVQMSLDSSSEIKGYIKRMNFLSELSEYTERINSVKKLNLL